MVSRFPSENAARRRVGFVTRNFPPLTGGMERLNFHVFKALANASAVALCAPAGASRFAGSSPCIEVPLFPLARFLMAAQWGALRVSREFRPQIFYSGSGLTAPAALVAARSVGARTACFLHGLDVVARHPLYRTVFLPAIRRIDTILVNSHHTAGLAAAAGVTESRISILHPGVDVPDLGLREQARLRFCSALGLGNNPLLLSAGRLTQRKGLVEFIRASLPIIAASHPGVRLVVVGAEPANALQHRRGVRDAIEGAAREVGLSDRVLLLGEVSDAVLRDAYFSADLLVFPALDFPGDVEGFGMVALEAAAHGTPTVAFRVGGIPDAVRDGVSGYLVEAGQYRDFADRISAILAKEEVAPLGAESCHRFASDFSWTSFERRLLGLMD